MNNQHSFVDICCFLFDQRGRLSPRWSLVPAKSLTEKLFSGPRNGDEEASLKVSAGICFTMSSSMRWPALSQTIDGWTVKDGLICEGASSIVENKLTVSRYSILVLNKLFACRDSHRIHLQMSRLPGSDGVPHPILNKNEPKKSTKRGQTKRVAFRNQEIITNIFSEDTHSALQQKARKLL